MVFSCTLNGGTFQYNHESKIFAINAISQE